MSEEENAERNAEETSFVDSALGGDDDGAAAPESGSHSPADEEHDLEDAADAGDQPIPEDDELDDGFADDDSNGEGAQNAPEAPEVDVSRLKQEIEGLQKRLHDTQAAMHKATGERARLQKELQELKTKQDNEEDWFSEDDRERTEQLEQDLKRSDEEIARVQAEEQEITGKKAVAEWDAAAAPVIRKHPDFEKVVYGDLVPLLDPKTGDPTIRAQWESLPDKSPAATYEFAKKALEIREFQRDPQAYKKRLRKEFKTHGGSDRRDDAPVGKEGLDMTPSADMPDAVQPRRNMSFVDEVFG